MKYVRGFCGGLSVALISGCLANAEPLRTPSAGGDPWFEYRSEHFRLLSDLRQPDALNGAQLDHDLAQHLLKSIPWRERHLSPRPPPEDFSTRALADSEVLTLWARLDDFNGPNQARAEQRLEQAVRADPRDDQASAWLDRFSKRAEGGH